MVMARGEGVEREDRRRRRLAVGFVRDGAEKVRPSSSSVVLAYDWGEVIGDAFGEGGLCWVVRVRFAGGGRDQFGGSWSAASSAGGEMERWRLDSMVLSMVVEDVRFDLSIRSLPVPKSAVFRSEPFLFRVFVWRITPTRALS